MATGRRLILHSLIILALLTFRYCNSSALIIRIFMAFLNFFSLPSSVISVDEMFMPGFLVATAILRCSPAIVYFAMLLSFRICSTTHFRVLFTMPHFVSHWAWRVQQLMQGSFCAYLVFDVISKSKMSHYILTCSCICTSVLDFAVSSVYVSVYTLYYGYYGKIVVRFVAFLFTSQYSAWFIITCCMNHWLNRQADLVFGMSSNVFPYFLYPLLSVCNLEVGFSPFACFPLELKLCVTVHILVYELYGYWNSNTVQCMCL